MQKHEAFEGEKGNNRLYLVTCVIYTELGISMCWVACHHWYHTLLYLPTQIRFLIGGERVRCHCSTLHDALGRTKLHDALGQQQLELSTRTWSVRALLKPRKNLFASRVKQIIFYAVMAAKRFQTRTEEEIEQLLHDKSSKSTNKGSDNAVRTWPQRSRHNCNLINSYRPRPHVSGYFWIRNFFFPDTERIRRIRIRRIRRQIRKFLNPLSRVKIFESDNISDTCGRSNPDIFWYDDVTKLAQVFTSQI